MLICPHLCWQQFPALVLLPCSLASGHLHDVSISQVLPCIHLSLQSLDYICIVGLPPVDKESPGADKPCISSLSLLSYRFLFLFHLSCSSWCYASHFFFQWLSFLWIDILQFIQVYFGVWQEEFSRFKDMAVFISRNCC